MFLKKDKYLHFAKLLWRLELIETEQVSSHLMSWFLFIYYKKKL